MKKNRSRSKLTLAPETVRVLSSAQLAARVLGGDDSADTNFIGGPRSQKETCGPTTTFFACP